MKNVDITVENNTLIIKIDLAKEYGPSKSGKNITVAGTEGNKTVPLENGGEVKVGLNVYKSR